MFKASAAEKRNCYPTVEAIFTMFPLCEWDKRSSHKFKRKLWRNCVQQFLFYFGVSFIAKILSYYNIFLNNINIIVWQFFYLNFLIALTNYMKHFSNIGSTKQKHKVNIKIRHYRELLRQIIGQSYKTNLVYSKNVEHITYHNSEAHNLLYIILKSKTFENKTLKKYKLYKKTG